MNPETGTREHPLHVSVFLSSPGDVHEERRIALKILKELPDEALLKGKVFIEPVAWDDPSAPTPLTANETPQRSVNRFSRKPSQCDLTIVILWSKLGTPLPPEERKRDGSTYASGTEWELEDARNAGKLVFVYHRTAPPLASLDDPDLAEKRRQYEAVKGFVCQFRNPGGPARAGYNEYESPEAFAKIFKQHLETYLRKKLEVEHGSEIEVLSGDWIEKHLADLVDQLECVTVPLAKKNCPRVLRLHSVYLPLKLRMAQHSPEGEQPTWVSLLKAPRVALTGDAGSGKSTLLRYIALQTTERLREQRDKAKAGVNAVVPAGSSDDAIPATDEVARIPIFLNLARISSELFTKPERASGSVSEIPPTQWLPAFASRLRLAEPQAEAALREGNLLLLLDGLDEVADPSEREVLVEGITSLQRYYTPLRPQNHVIVSCREAAWGTGEWFARFDKVTILPMDRETIDQYLSKWGRAVWGNEAERILNSLQRSLSSSAPVRDLATNPQLGMLLALVEYEGDLPRQEARLFEHFVRRLARIEGASARTDTTRRNLITLAVEMQRSTGAEGEPLNAMKIQKARLLLAKQHLPEGGAGVSKQTLREVGELLLNSLEVETGLIEVDRSEGFSEHRSMVRFKHRTFQEYLAACHYAEREGVDELLRHVTDPSWSKVLALACGVRAQGDEKDVRDLLKWMLKAPDFQKDGVLPCATLVDWVPRVAAASACLAELASYDLDEETLEPARRAHDLVLPLLVGAETKVDIQTRARIADGLGSIFDPRLKPDLRWVKVPSGWFVRGSESEEAWIQERPRTKVFVDDFLIRRWPVTVAEYRCFLEGAAGYEADAWWLDVEGRRWWHADGIKAPLGWEKNRSRGNCPVTGVSWWEARAFCRWYNTVNSGLPPGWRVELPLEAQW